jgi:hypothetical protein
MARLQLSKSRPLVCHGSFNWMRVDWSSIAYSMVQQHACLSVMCAGSECAGAAGLASCMTVVCGTADRTCQDMRRKSDDKG